MSEVFTGGLSRVVLSTDIAVDGSGSGISVEIPITIDVVGLDFTEDMFTNSMSGTLILTNRTAWDVDLKGVKGTEWLTLSFLDALGNPISQRFKIYKVTSEPSETNTLTTYVFSFTTYQLLIDSLKYERHLNNDHIGPISTSSSYFTENEDEDKSPTNQDYGLVNKIMDDVGFDLDIEQVGNKPIIDIEESGNWINFIPSYLDNRDSPDVVDANFVWNQQSTISGGGSAQKDARPKKVFNLLNELASNSVCKDNTNAANFLLWHDLRGWHYRSIDSFLRNNPKVEKQYSYAIAQGGGDVGRIIDLRVTKPINYVDLLNKQALSSKIIYYELNPESSYAQYYLTLPSSMSGLQKIIGPAGLDNSIGNTVIEKQAIIESGLSYDYLLDRDKWSSVEKYSILPDKENLYTEYTDPSFLEIPTEYLKEGIGRESWFGTSPVSENTTVNAYYNSSYKTVNQFNITNPHEYFKSKFIRQTDLSGPNFRIVHDKIKKPIINAMKEYYEACIQRLYFEHNLVIMGGLNTLESGEGTLGRGPNKEYCEYCLDRNEMISRIQQHPSYGRIRDYVNEYCTFGDGVLDSLCVESRLFGYGLIDTFGYIDDEAYDEMFGGMAVCNAVYRDYRTRRFAETRLLDLERVGDENRDQARWRIQNELPIIEYDVIAKLSPDLVGESYPRCFSNEPLLPYNGDHVDCQTIREKYEAIPSECKLIKDNLGSAYVCPEIRGKNGTPVNLYNLTFWNGYWVNPRFGIPNLINFKEFWGNNVYNNGPYGETNFQFFESELFLKDYKIDEPYVVVREGDVTGYWNNESFWFEDSQNFDYAATSNYTPPEGIPSHVNEFIEDENWESNLNTCERDCQDDDDQIFSECRCRSSCRGVGTCTGGFGCGPNPSGEVIQSGSTITYTNNITVDKKVNINYKRIKECTIPKLCGNKEVIGETIEIPYASKIEWTVQQVDEYVCRYNCGGFGGLCDEITNPVYAWVLTDSNIATVSVDWPSYYTIGKPYSYGSLDTMPFNTFDYKNNPLDRTFVDILRQFGFGGDYNADSGSGILQSPSGRDYDERTLALLRGALGDLKDQINYFPNNNLGLYDSSRPIYNKDDWENFLECGGTCVGGSEGQGSDINIEGSKAIEYAKYCSYAWNRYWSTPKEQPLYRRAQMELIQSQEIEITVPNDLSLEIGHIVSVSLPKPPSSSVDDKTATKQQLLNPASGKYLVTGIRRIFSGTSSRQEMKVRLNRDSLPFDPNGDI